MFCSWFLLEVEFEIGVVFVIYLVDEGIKIVSGIIYEFVCKIDDGGVVFVIVWDGCLEILIVEWIFVVMGCCLNIEVFGFVEIGIDLILVGVIIVDDCMCILKVGVYVVGDVIGKD